MMKFSYLMVKSYNLMGNSRPCFHDKNPVPKVPSEIVNKTPIEVTVAKWTILLYPI